MIDAKEPITLTGSELYHICKANKYILVRDYKDNELTGINCAIHKMAIFEDQQFNKAESNYISYKKCSFMEYINYKTPFI